MSKRILASSVFVSLAISLLPVMPARGQSPFFQAVTSLNPVAYWPLQETNAPPMPDVETNYGTLGTVANAFYPSTNQIRSVGGAIVDGLDTAVSMSAKSACWLQVPAADSRTAPLSSAFTVEIWENPANVTNVTVLISHAGGLNGGPTAGWALYRNMQISSGGTLNRPGWCFHVYNGVGSTGGAEAIAMLPSLSAGTWYHLVGVFDGTRAYLYVNGVNSTSFSTPINGSYVPDTWTTLYIGGGAIANYSGMLDEVAIYPSALTALQIANHYDQARTSDAAYVTAVLANNPLMYYRMDAGNGYITPPDISAYPVAMNYGSAANINGLYLSGTTPGSAGPSGGFGSPSYACAFNGGGTDATNTIPLYNNGTPYATNVANSGVLITNLDSSLNLTNHDETLMCWFKGNPADNRFQNLVGHGNSGFRLALYNGGNAGQVAWMFGAGGNLTSPTAGYNDGNWHFAVGVYTNAGPATPYGWLGTNYLYVDGVLVSSAAVTNVQTVNSLTNNAVMLGGAPDYIASGNNNSYNQRFFNGSLAHVAYFTNALSADAILNLYSNGLPNMAPAIYAQPYPYPSVRTVTGGTGVYIYEAVIAGGTPPLAYQWYYNSSSNYSGATALTDGAKYTSSTASQVTITNLVNSDSGYYFAVVTNRYGAVTSAVVNVRIYAAPVITAQSPSGAFNLFMNQSSTLSVTVSAATNTLSYQWLTNGVADTAAGTNSTYALTGVQLAQSGETFQCIVTNVYGSATSVLATLTVQRLPAFLTNSIYGSNMLALSPTVYYPMHEVAPAAAAGIETNYGTLGALGTAYYADWNVNNGNPGNSMVLHGTFGALANDPDPAAEFLKGANSYLLVPHTSPQTTLTPPFTLECWVASWVTTFGDIISQSGTKLNGGNANNAYGFRLSWGGNIQTYGPATVPGSGQLALGQWHHVALTYEGTNMVLYVDGSQVSSSVTTSFIPDSWDPLTIGQGLWNNTGPTRSTTIYIDEVAIYTNVLQSTDISTHYNDGTSGSAGQYYTDVMSLHPLLYYRMNSPTFTVPPSSAWPVMTNYGTAAVNGTYQPGLAPGSVPGPNSGTGLNAVGLSGANSAPMNGLSTYALAYTPVTNVFNPPAAGSPLSFSLWFKGSPSDTRYQALISQGPGWQLGQQTNGLLQFYLGGSGSSYLYSTRVYNDGYWHQAVVTYATNVACIYVDGLLDSTATNSALTNPPPTTAYGTGIGCDPRYTAYNQTAGAGRQYAGNICEVAFWNGTALSPGQVQTLYNAAGVLPTIMAQPLSTTNNAGENYTNTVAVIGAMPLAYQWYQNGTAVSGQTASSLIYNPIAGTNAGSYYVVITNAYGAATSSVVTLTVYTAPIFTLQPPATCTLYAGGSVTFSVAASGASPIYYYWLSNNVPLAGATNTSYTLTNAQVSASASYSCLASNKPGYLTSSAVSLTVVARPTTLYPAAVLHDIPIGYWRLNETSENGSGNNGTLANDYWGGNFGVYSNTFLAQDGYSRGLSNQFGYYPATDPDETSAQFGYYPSYGATSNYVANISGIDLATPTNTSGAFSIEAWAKGDSSQSYSAGIVAKGAWGAEQFTLDTGGGSGHSYRFTMREAGNTVRFIGSNTNLPDGNWHHLVGVLDQPNSNACFYVDGVKVASLACSPSNGVLSTAVPVSIGCRLGNSGKYDQQFFGNVNDVAIYNYALSSTQVVNHYLAAGITPRFVQQPVFSTNVNEGTTLSIPAQALGTLPMSYQWYDVTSGTPGTPLTDQTNAMLVINNISAALYNNHYLALTVTNIYGQTNSSMVSVTVQSGPPAMVNITPSYLTLYAGRPVVFTVSAQGTQPFFYQWSVDGNNVAGATSASYTNLVQLGSHAIGCTVNNSIDSSSATANLNGVASPTDNYAVKILNNQPLAYWRLDEALNASVANDYVGGHNAYYYNATNGLLGFSPSDTAAGFGMNGVANYSLALEAENSGYGIPQIDFSTQGASTHFSVEAWIKAPVGQISGAGIVTKGYGNGGEQFSLDVYTNHFRFYVHNAANNATRTVISPNIGPDGFWHHLVAVCDQINGSLYLYIDGALNATGTIIPGEGLLGPLPAGSPVLTSIGSRMKNSSDSSYSNQLTNAVVDEVAVYSDALSSTDVAAHYAAAAQPPRIVQDLQPRMDAYVGFPMSLSVLASGGLSLGYQWQKNGMNLSDGGTVSGAHTNTLTLSVAQFSDSGTYRVIVTDQSSGITATSTVATVTVLSRLQFNGSGAGWSINGSTNSVPKYTGTNLLQLTDGSKYEASSSFFSYPVYVGGFRATFTYQDVGIGGADGMAFVVQNDSRGVAALGVGGGGFGYNGITNSAAVEFNIYVNNGVGYAFQTNGLTGKPYGSATPVNLASGDPINVTLLYADGVLSMTLTDAVAQTSFTASTDIDIPAAVGADSAYVGFTGADGGTASTQTVSNFTFVSLPGMSIQATPDNHVVITWPAAVGGYVLQQSLSLLPANWTTVSTPPTNVGGLNQVTLPMSVSGSFYRLINTP